MKFTAELIDNPWVIRAYEPGWIRIGETIHRHNLLLMPERILEPWPVDALERLTPEDLSSLTLHRPEVILFGTGAQQKLLHSTLLAPLAEAGIGHEVMDTGAACRTYNILLSEGRSVLAALIL